jgi:signal transduction histidine kinase
MRAAFIQRLRPTTSLRRYFPRWTVRVRLTLLYSILFSLCGVALLTITYLLVHRSTQDAVFSNGATERNGPSGIFQHSFTGSPNVQGTRQFPTAASQLQAQVAHVQANDLHQLLVQSEIALAIMGLVAIALGYFVAGRALRPLRTITATARGISASTLHERVAVVGPNDELKELGDTFDELLERLEGSFNSQRQFVANASHELRSPLTRLRLLAEVAATDAEATVESLQAMYQRVVTASEQQEKLIEALLALAKSQGGLDHREPFDLSVVTNEVLLAPRQEVERLGLHLEATLNPAKLTGDPRLVERLVSNLMDNAVRHNVARGKVQVTTTVDHGGAMLVVCNDGPNVPTKELDRLFLPFQRLAAGRMHHKDGHGLGLSIVEAVANAHGAVITALPRAEGGLRIEVRFPVSDVETASNRAKGPERTSAPRTWSAPIEAALPAQDKRSAPRPRA